MSSEPFSLSFFNALIVVPIDCKHLVWSISSRFERTADNSIFGRQQSYSLTNMIFLGRYNFKCGCIEPSRSHNWTNVLLTNQYCSQDIETCMMSTVFHLVPTPLRTGFHQYHLSMYLSSNTVYGWLRAAQLSNTKMIDLSKHLVAKIFGSGAEPKTHHHTQTIDKWLHLRTCVRSRFPPSSVANLFFNS